MISASNSSCPQDHPLKKTISAVFLVFCFCLSFSTPGFPDSTETAAIDHAEKGDKYLKEGLPFLAIEEYRQAANLGLLHPDLFRNLGIALYDLGLIDDAIIELEKSVSFSSDSDLLHTELGILYLAKGKNEKAKKQFFAALKKNPGSANTYYYLGELFFRTKDYELSRMSARMAQQLGHKGKDLYRKLSALPETPETTPWNTNDQELFVRQILVDSEEKAKDVLERISIGELFDDIAGIESMATNATLGGYAGRFKPSELHPAIAKVLLEREIFSEPVIVKTEKGFHIVQRIAPFDFIFWEQILAGSDKSPPEGVRTIQATKWKKRVKFIIHAGSFRDQGVAQQIVDKLHDRGFPSYSFIIENESSGIWHGVIAGKYDTQKEALEAAEKISQQGYDNFIYQD